MTFAPHTQEDKHKPTVTFLLFLATLLLPLQHLPLLPWITYMLLPPLTFFPPRLPSSASLPPPAYQFLPAPDIHHSCLTFLSPIYLNTSASLVYDSSFLKAFLCLFSSLYTSSFSFRFLSDFLPPSPPPRLYSFTSIHWYLSSSVLSLHTNSFFVPTPSFREPLVRCFIKHLTVTWASYRAASISKHRPASFIFTPLS